MFVENQKAAEFLMGGREAGQRDPENVSLLEICRNLEEAMKLGGGSGGVKLILLTSRMAGRPSTNISFIKSKLRLQVIWPSLCKK